MISRIIDSVEGAIGQRIYSIVAALILLGLTACSRNPRENEACSDISNLVNSVLMFRAEYGYNPVPTDEVGVTALKDTLPILLASSNSASAMALNPNAVRFLDIPSFRLQRGEYIDPWGNPYHIAFAKKKEQITAVGKYIVNAPVAVWSNGENGRNEEGNGDDIRSWK